MSTPEIIVIGGGVSGLSCASELADAGRRVEVWTATPPEQTTSNIAAAFWYPFHADPVERVVPWAITSYERFASIAADLTHGPVAGIRMREALDVFAERVPDPPWGRYVDMFRHAALEELPEGYGHGFVFAAPVVEMPVYLPWLVARLERLGVQIITRELDSLAPALDVARVVVNASGLGARELVGDERVYPVRGQILVHERNDLSRVFIDEHGPTAISYVIPRSNDVILGGVADEHLTDLDENPAQSEDIYARCTKLEPELEKTKRIGVKVGLRPYRDQVRLEHEVRDGKLIVHNYGHGGAGVTLSWGCAQEVRERVMEWWKSQTGAD